MIKLANKILIGTAAGAAATVPMTVLMLVWHRILPRGEQYHLPPREIVDELIERADAETDLREADKTRFAFAAHFAYGAGCGAVYAAIAQKPNAASGAIFGGAVWTISYLGWIPALEILRPATEHPRRRNALMIASNVFFGACAGEIARRMERRFD